MRTASAAADQNNQLALQTAQQQTEQNLIQAQQQSDMDKLIQSRTAALDAQVGPTAPQPFNLAPIATIMNSELGDQSTAQTSRNKLLGN